MDPKTDDKDVASKSENMKKIQALDLTTAPKETEPKTVSFKTSEIIAFREQQEKLFDHKLEAMERKNNAQDQLDISKSDTTQNDMNEDEHDTYEVDEESDDEIPCSQMKRSPCLWTKLDQETGEEQEAKMTKMEQGE